jgi:NTP pyrophosphatase (non-canonical NTP hydrolase)
MNVQEHLVVCLAEECGEVIQAATKFLRFGAMDRKPGTNITNSRKLYDELCDVETLIKMLRDSGAIGGIPQATTEKEHKVLDHIVIARKLGTIQ